MSWTDVFEGVQWGMIFFLLFKGAWNETRIDTLEDKKK